MKLVAIDSSGNVAGVALGVDGRIIGEYSINNKKTHSVTLLPMLKELCERADHDIRQTDALVLAAGPGSFTGLRIGAAAGKGIAEALGCPILPVPTLEGLCQNVCEWRGVICPMLDARRSQVYSGIYRFDGGELKQLHKVGAYSVEEQLKRLNEIKDEVLFLGDGADAYRNAIEGGMKMPYTFAPPHRRYQSAAALIARAEALGSGALVAAEDFAPEYFRQSQAERERAERLKEAER